MKVIIMFIAIGLVVGSVALCAQNSNFKQGYYFDKSQNKVSGYIYYDISTGFKFKATPTDKAVRLTTTEVDSFVVGSDLYIELKDFSVGMVSQIGKTKMESAFVLVKERGPLNLYQAMVYGYSPTVGTMVEYRLVARHNLTGSTIGLPKRKKAFVQSMCLLTADCPGFCEKIKANGWGYDECTLLVREYNKSMKSLK